MARSKRWLGADGGSVENQARAVCAQDMRTAQELVATHLAKAPDVMLKEDGAGGRPSHASGERRINAILTERLPASGVVFCA
jgi:hypothetical protein